MTDTWEDDGGPSREETLYHESARELARMVVDLEEALRNLAEENVVLKRHIAWLHRDPDGVL